MILDTSAVIAVHRRTLGWDVVLDDEDDEPAIAAITAAELLVGVPVDDDALRARRQRDVEMVFETLTIEPYDLDVARVHAELMATTGRRGDPRGAHDLQIAATARARNRTVVTLDRRGFEDLPGVSVRAAA